MKKFLVILASIFVFATTAFALPGIESYMPENAGEFVYYKDSTFTRESYIGICLYEEDSFQVRYYAPEDTANKLPAKELAILVSTNPDADHLEMTGENILSQVMPGTEDVDLVNYLHDILYEFSARRGKKDPITQTDYIAKEEYAQFGGSVKIVYNVLVPIFNIQKIIGQDETTVLECVCIGSIKDSSDFTFEKFIGIPVVTKEVKNKAKIKKAKAANYKFDNHSITLDSNWTQSMENLWLYGDEAIISMAQIPNYTPDVELNKLFIVRKLMESSNYAYIDFASAKIDLSPSVHTLEYRTFQSTSAGGKYSNVIQNYKILTLNEKGGFEYFTLTAFLNAYNSKNDYFKNIIQSYK